MGEAKRKQKLKTTKTSSVRKKKVVPSELNSEELLDQILNKKRKVKPVEIKTEKVDVSKLSDDELLDFIMAKKKKKKVASTKKKSASTKKESTIKTKVTPKKKAVEETVVDTENLIEKVQIELQIEEVNKEYELLESKNNRRKTTLRRFVLSTLCLLTVCGFYFGINLIKEPSASYALVEDKNIENIENIKKIEEENNKKFNECLTNPYTAGEESDEIIAKEKELTDYLKKYRVSIGYRDLELGFHYYYNESDIYYAASTIKSIDALYIYTKAAEGEIDLDETITYTSKYRMGSSSATQNISYGTKITLRDLVKYAITVSDNSAHNMLVNYIGKNNLREFGKSLGATTTLGDWDLFGNINVYDAMIYMEAIYKFVQENGELGQELASYFIESEDNNLKFEDLNINALTKYGNYDVYYHNIGVVDSFHPYTLVILTKVGQKNGRVIMPEISKKVMELHDLYYENRQSTCMAEVYGK